MRLRRAMVLSVLLGGRINSKCCWAANGVRLFLAGSDSLTRRWRELVEKGCITATIAATSEGGPPITYGLRREVHGIFVEFVENSLTGENLLSSERAGAPEAAAVTRLLGSQQIYLSSIRRLRPPATARLDELPPHEPLKCSFCSGPLSLDKREKAGLWESGSDRSWDVHFNISPMTPQGHFLFVPSINVPANCRMQELLQSDCQDMVSAGLCFGKNWCINYNSRRAGASQNHIHIHCWRIDEKLLYAAQMANYLPGAKWTSHSGEAVAHVLDYPAFCVCVEYGSSSSSSPSSSAGIEEAQAALHALTLECVVHNVAVIGRRIFFFPRGEETAQDILPGFKIGSAQMLGLWAVDSESAVQRLTKDGTAIERALEAAGVERQRGMEMAQRAFEKVGFERVGFL
jgi:hypothetical protein